MIFWRRIPVSRVCRMEIIMRKSVGIIGGGAAGMMAAITAARQGAHVTVLERGERVGRKLLSTGNGRCNLGNMELDAGQYYGSSREWLENALKRFDTEDTIQFFQGLGLLIKNKNGYLYPACEQASVVLDVLRIELKTLGVQIINNVKVNHISKEEAAGQILINAGDESYLFDSVVLACGGKAAPKTGSDGSGYKLAKQLGHRLIPTVPALVQLKCREEYLKAVAGVRADAEISVFSQGKCVARQRGELQLTDYGISGIVVFQISRIVNYILREQEETEVIINLLPDYTRESFEQLCTIRSLLKEGRSIEEFFTGMLNKKLMQLFVKMAGLKPDMSVEEVDEGQLRQVYELCREWKLHALGSNSYENAQVCAGGVDTGDITENMESKKVSGIYFAGEVMDVDGKCGGYNLQWAWSSGYLAGMAASGYPVAEVKV